MCGAASIALTPVIDNGSEQLGWSAGWGELGVLVHDLSIADVLHARQRTAELQPAGPDTLEPDPHELIHSSRLAAWTLW